MWGTNTEHQLWGCSWPSRPCQVCLEGLASAIHPRWLVKHPLRPRLLVLFSLWTHYSHRELSRALSHVKFTCIHYSKPVTKNRARTAETVGNPEMREGVKMQSPLSGGARMRGFSSPSPQTIHSPTLFTPSLQHHSLQWHFFPTVEPQHIIIQNTLDLKLALKKHF